jgi:hypothetical protein
MRQNSYDWTPGKYALFVVFRYYGRIKAIRLVGGILKIDQFLDHRNFSNFSITFFSPSFSHTFRSICYNFKIWIYQKNRKILKEGKAKPTRSQYP